MLCASLDGREVWGRMDTCKCMTESLHCSLETTTTLLIGCTPIQHFLNESKTTGHLGEMVEPKAGVETVQTNLEYHMPGSTQRTMFHCPSQGQLGIEISNYNNGFKLIK